MFLILKFLVGEKLLSTLIFYVMVVYSMECNPMNDIIYCVRKVSDPIEF